MSRLDWRCRRGTKELDVLLQRYLKSHYGQAPAAERQAFERMLDLQDPQLQDYLSGYLEAPEADTRTVIHHILNGITVCAPNFSAPGKSQGSVGGADLS